MRIHRLVRSVNWTYAVGELSLIVVGITIALGVNSWYEDWRLRSEEISYLERFRDSLATDLDNVSRINSLIEDAVARLEVLRLHLEAGRPYSPALDEAFAEVQFFYGATLRTSIYEALRSRGFDLISNDELQVALIDLYEERNEALERQNSYLREVAFNQAQPYVRERFRVDIGAAKPYDYDQLLADRGYWNLIGVRVMGYVSFTLPNYRAAVEEIRQTIMLIDAELEELK